jgi:hypothetical protein
MTNFLLLNDYSTLEDSSALISEFATLKQRGILFCNGHLQRILSGSRYRRMYDYEHRDFKRCVCELALPRQWRSDDLFDFAVPGMQWAK